MTFNFSEYAGMDAYQWGIWLLLLGLAGYLARLLLGGPKPIGVYGDTVIATLGVFILGNVLRNFNIDPSASIAQYLPASLPLAAAIWADIFIVGFLGAMILRIPLRIVGGRG